MATERVYCSDLARAAQAELAGTMERIDLWVLLEVPRPWKRKALEDNELPADVQAWLGGIKDAVRAHSGLQARVLFVKQRTSTDTPGHTLTLAFSAERGSRLYRWEAPRYRDLAAIDVADIAAQVRADMADGDTARTAPLVPPGATLLDAPQVLVCTNGQRDLCCARFGLPLFEALATEHGEVVWQTSHIGGHRYAPNLVVLPQGSVYGFVEPDLGSSVLAAEAGGDLVLAHLRGRTCHDQPVQAAEVHLRRRLGLAGRDALALAGAEDGDGVVTATFTTADGTRHDQAVRAEPAEVQASCGADGVKTATLWVPA